MPSASGSDGASSAAPRSRARLALAGLLLLDSAVAAVMLATDKNLQTDFGSVAPYYVHWYGVLAMGLVSLVGALVLLATSGSTPGPSPMGLFGRRGATLGLGWSIVAILAMVGAVSTYAQVQFSSASEFAKYLFVPTPYPGALSYIPWLYDLLLVLFGVTAADAAVAMRDERLALAQPAGTRATDRNSAS